MQWWRIFPSLEAPQTKIRNYNYYSFELPLSIVYCLLLVVVVVVVVVVVAVVVAAVVAVVVVVAANVVVVSGLSSENDKLGFIKL